MPKPEPGVQPLPQPPQPVEEALPPQDPNRVYNLTLDELGLTFRVLVGKLPVQQLPPRLHNLRPEDWSVLRQLLADLQIQKGAETLH